MIKPQTVQLPKVTELIDDVAASWVSIFSVCDFYSAFYQIQLAPKSRPLTTFSSPEGRRYQFSRCPFDLSTSAAGMIYVVQKVMAGKLGDSGRLYMDDALLFSNNWQDHIRTIETLLTTLGSNNLTENPAKCEWEFPNVLFLWFQIGLDGLKMDPKKTKVIEKLAPPTNRKGLQRLGLFLYEQLYGNHEYQMTSYIA